MLQNSRFKTVLIGLLTPVVLAAMIMVFVRSGKPSSAAQIEESSFIPKMFNSIDPIDAFEYEYDSDQLNSSQRRIAQLRQSGIGNLVNPFYYRPNQTEMAQDVESEPSESEKESVIEIPRMRLTGIMRGRQMMAIINGNLYQVGQAVEDGWKITKIDAEEHTVVVEGPDGTEITLDSES